MNKVLFSKKGKEILITILEIVISITIAIILLAFVLASTMEMMW